MHAERRFSNINPLSFQTTPLIWPLLGTKLAVTSCVWCDYGYTDFVLNSAENSKLNMF